MVSEGGFTEFLGGWEKPTLRVVVGRKTRRGLMHLKIKLVGLVLFVGKPRNLLVFDTFKRFSFLVEVAELNAFLELHGKTLWGFEQMNLISSRQAFVQVCSKNNRKALTHRVPKTVAPSMPIHAIG